MSKMLLLAIRHDKLDEVEKVNLGDLLSVQEKENVLEKSGVIISSLRDEYIGDNLLITDKGVGYINTSGYNTDIEIAKSSFQEVKKDMDTSTRVLNILNDTPLTVSENIPEVKGAAMTLFGLYERDLHLINNRTLADAIEFIKNEDTVPTLNKDDCFYDNGSRIRMFNPLRAIATLSEDCMAMVTLKGEFYGIYTLPNMPIEISSKNLKEDLKKSLSAEETLTKKFKMS